MPSIFINTNPPSKSKITEFIDLVFICDDEEQIIYNSLTIYNEGTEPIRELSVYTPFSTTTYRSKVHSKCRRNEIKAFYDNFSEIQIILHPQEIKPKSSMNIELIFKVKNIEKKTKHGYPVILSFYNMNYIKDFQLETVMKDCIPAISRTGICLGTICRDKYTFSNTDSTAELSTIDNITNNHIFINKAITRVSEIFSNDQIEWSELMLWSNPQLSTLPESISPDYSGRAVKAFFEKEKFIEIFGMKFSRPDMISISLAIVSILIGIYSFLF